MRNFSVPACVQASKERKTGQVDEEEGEGGGGRRRRGKGASRLKERKGKRRRMKWRGDKREGEEEVDDWEDNDYD